MFDDVLKFGLDFYPVVCDGAMVASAVTGDVDWCSGDDVLLGFCDDWEGLIEQEEKTLDEGIDESSENNEEEDDENVEITVQFITAIIETVEQVRYGKINASMARRAGYLHPSLLKHELKQKYGEIEDDEILHWIKFTIEVEDDCTYQ